MRLSIIGLTLLTAMSMRPTSAYSQADHGRVVESPLKHDSKPTQAQVSLSDLMTRLYIFADDSMEGRKYQTRGNVKGTTYLATELQKLGLEPAGDSGTYFQTLPYDPAKGQHPGRNVVAILRGTDPNLNRTYVALGAHNDGQGIRSYVLNDHDSSRTHAIEIRRLRQVTANKTVRDSLGRTFVVNVDSLRRLRPSRRDSIANSADDDGSGSVAVLEIAEALAKLPRKPKRSILFVFHTGEEAGLLGAKYFTEHPTVPLDSIVAMVNLDMIGRGRVEDTPEGGPDMLMVVGARRLSTALGRTVEAVNIEKGHRLEFDYTWDAPNHPAGIYGASDHYEYAKRGIPVAFFFTGFHLDYHAVTDEPQYIDYPHLERIARYVYDLVVTLGAQPSRPPVDSLWQRKEQYGKYLAEISLDGRLILYADSVALTDTQRASVRRLVKTHDAQQRALLDSLVVGVGRADTTAGIRRSLELATRQLGAYRRILTPKQQAVFDAKAQQWVQKRELEGYRVAVPGVQR